MNKVNTFGAEVEKVVTNLKTGKSYPVSQKFFKNLKTTADKRRVKNHYHFSDVKNEIILAVVSDDLGEQGLDNGFNLLETSLNYQKSLTDLNQKMLIDLKTTQESLEREGASVVNLSIHPLGKRDMKTYRKMVAPKGVYPYLWYRGWDHSAGIDARAQNSPSTGVNVYQAADAISAILGTGAAFIALFANSPYEEGKKSEYKESRLKIWDRMMKNSEIEGDRITANFPSKRFETMAQYFSWMFGGKTGIHFVLENIQEDRADSKSVGDKIIIIEGLPPLMTYLSKKEWTASYFKDLKKGIKKTVVIKPTIVHMEAMQFSQFAGARIRYGLNHKDFPLEDFVKACKQPSKLGVEEIFAKYAKYIYIEGRDAGANFPDAEILVMGDGTAKSVIISPSALQAGLIKNLAKVTKYLDKFEWSILGKLRDTAIKDGLQGKAGNLTVEEFTKNILALAEEGLEQREKWMLNYPKWVLKTKQNGADRAIKFVSKFKGNLNEALVELVKARKVIV